MAKGAGEKVWGCPELWHLVQKPPTAPLTPQEAREQWSNGPGEQERGCKDLSFHTHLSASIAQEQSRGRKGRWVFSLPWWAPTVSTLAIGSNPERVSKARRNSDIVVPGKGSLRWRLLGGTLGPAAAAAAATATARSPELSSVIYKCHWEFFSSMSPASPPSPAWSRMWKV